MEWITKLVYLQMLWLLFTMMGCVIGGIFPATSAVFTITRKWMDGEEKPVFKLFWQIYKRDFLSANLLGYMLLLIGYFIHADISHFHNVVLNYISHILALAFLVVIVYIGPVFTLYDTNVIQQIKYAFVIGVMKPLKTLLMIANLIAALLLMMTFVKLIPFFCISLLAYLLTRISYTVLPVKHAQNAGGKTL
jgi:uncharacterized membrane protein YesL